VDECDLDLKHCKGVGIGAPGSVDAEAGRVIFAPNLGWKDFALKKELEKGLERPVATGNDCNVSALGVYEKEFAARPRNMIGIFIGTGIGGGIIMDGKLYSGANHMAGEVGHMVIDMGGPKCGCGNRGCLEALASRSAMFRRIQSAVKDGEKTVLTDMLGPALQDLRSGDLRKAIKRGDKLATKVVRDSAEYIGIAVANLVNIFNPELFVLGGGVIDALEEVMFEDMLKSAREHIFPGMEKGLQIVASKLGDDAGITGAAVLAKKQMK
jgi:glucokinase